MKKLILAVDLDLSEAKDISDDRLFELVASKISSVIPIDDEGDKIIIVKSIELVDEK